MQPCFYEYYGTPGEVVTSLLSAATVEPVVENENKYCPFRFLKSSAITDNNLLDVCGSPENEWRLCRADSRGVWELPPGEVKCLVYVNGPAAAIGVLSASGFAGVTSGLGNLK